MNSAPGNTPTSSSQNSYVVLHAFGPVVIKIPFRPSSCSCEKKSANGSVARSASISACVSCERSAVRFDEGSNSLVLSKVRGTFAASRFALAAGSDASIDEIKTVLYELNICGQLTCFGLRQSFCEFSLTLCLTSLVGYFFPFYLVLYRRGCHSRRHSIESAKL